MPELPEVETIRLALKNGGRGAHSILGHRVQESCLLWERTLAEPNPQEFHACILGQEITDVDRRGKFLLLRLSEDTLIIHLRMSGDLNVVNNSERRVWLVEDPITVVGNLGPEPLNGDFTAKVFHERLHAHRRQLKPLLLDQTFIAGLGNIYTDEALHLAQLHPLMISNTLTGSQAETLWSSIRQVLQEGIERQGASIDWVYRGGDFQNYFRVYQRTGDPCLNCGKPIQRITVGQRGTHYCQNCQPEPS